MKTPFARFCATAALILAVAGCGGGGGGGGSEEPPPPTGSVKEAISNAAAQAANDTSVNTSAPFSVLQNAGVPAVVVNSPPKVNFTVFSDGAVVRTLALSNVSFGIAKLVPGTNGDIDQWVNYVYRTETGAAGFGPDGNPVLPTAQQATLDPKTAATLVFNDDGYYTYTFTTDITDPAKTGGVVFEPDRTHRIAIQLSYVNAAGETVRVNPNFDVTFDANGNSVPVTDPSKTRKMVDVSSCNGCHQKLALHGGGRVDTQFCVMCHNPGTTDANSGHVVTFQTMVHKIHAGRLLKSKLAEGGEEFVIWGNQHSTHDFSEVGFPQDLRNCTKCHSGDNPATPQGDNWKTRPSKEACLTCHANKAGSRWDTRHDAYAKELVGAAAVARDLPNAQCAACHKPGSPIAPERVHWNQNEKHAAKYKMNIESVTFNDTLTKTGRSVTVKYFVSDPTNGNAAYDLVTPDCTGAAPNICPNTSKFGNLQLRVAYQNLVGQPTGVTEFTAYNNGGSTAVAHAYKGLNDGSNHYTVEIPLPDDTATAVAAGTARVVSVGQVKEPLLQVKSATDPRPEVEPRVLIDTAMQHDFKEFAISGPLTPRRKIVDTEKCNVCHGKLGTTSGSNTLPTAFHAGGRNIVEACVVCHDPNRMSSTVMTNGLTLNESYHFKRKIHGIHANNKRVYPFTHGNRIFGQFGKDGILLTDGLVVSGTAPNQTLDPVPTGSPLTAGALNFAAEVAWPGGNNFNCNACHVDDSYKVDRGTIGSVVSKLSVAGNPLSAAKTDPKEWMVITPKAATCTSCHDSAKAIGHVASFGFAGFGNLTQAQGWSTQETCADCHASGGIKGVDIVHRVK
jgi:OmcA/MtrC family decaheme c-type cytochrome